YIGQVLNVVSAVSSFFGMGILAALIYYFTLWLNGGNELVTGVFLFFAPACGFVVCFFGGGGRGGGGEGGPFGRGFQYQTELIF
ncbi:DUF2545 family protein, partial [Escherichia coli]|uniref:DUF2545 family protein n=1 Tax=Escherichia coli TaxID=562 RepID=UPI000D073245